MLNYIAEASVISGGAVISLSAVGVTRSEAISNLHAAAQANMQHLLIATLVIRKVV